MATLIAVTGPTSVHAQALPEIPPIPIVYETSELTLRLIAREQGLSRSEIEQFRNIAKCESHLEHTTEDGTLLRGRVNSQDVGIMQINEKYHLEESINLGLDIHTLPGNILYGIHLYKNQGTAPWNASRYCWENA